MKSIFTCLFVSVALFVSAQQNTFKVGSFATDYGYLNQLIQLTDGSYIGAGYRSDIDDGGAGYLLKTDAGGKVLAYKTIPGIGEADALIKTNDGGFAVCGISDNGVQLIKCKADLTIEWTKEYATSGFTRIRRMMQAADGSFLLAGTNASPESNLTAYAIKTDATGKLLFAKQYAGYAIADNADVELVDVVATTDGNYALAGLSSHYDNNGNDLSDSGYVIKINSAGDVLWTQAAYSNTGNQSVDPYRMIATSDGGLLIAGDLFTPATFSFRMAMMKYNNAGTLVWSKSVAPNDAGNTDFFGDGVIEDKDGGYLFYGAAGVYNDEDDTSYAYIAKTNSAGVLQWTKKYYPSVVNSFYAEFYDLIKTSDGGYAACGDGSIFYPDQGDYNESGFIVKLDQNFNTCNDSIASDGTLKNSIINVTKTATAENITTTTTDVSAFLNEGDETLLVCSNSTFPLQLLSFNATLQNKSVNVNWQTANEVNTNYFVIERSANGSSFTALQKIAAKGNSRLTQTYSTSDLQPLQGTSYYRLQQVDKDGKTTYSSIVKVVVMSNGTIVISPNPVQSNIRVIVQSSTNNSLTLQVMDMKGNVLATQKTSVAAGRNEVNIPAASLAKGVYILKVMDKGSVQTIRFVKD